jgi:organic radical activating enzyme
MSSYEALNYLDQASEFSTLRMVSLTGGEPFLLPKLLCEALSYSYERGFKTEVVTNCFWAESGKEAEEKLGSLVDLGLDMINISADDFHQEFIPFSYVRNCYEAAKELDLKITLLCSVAKFSRLRVEKIVDLLGDTNIHILERNKQSSNRIKTHAIAIESAFIPAGRGSQIPHKEWILGNHSTTGPCHHILQDIAIEPSGRVLPCCSTAGLINTLKLGNALREPLSRIIEKANTREIFKILARRGPQELLDVKYRNGPGRYVNKCHLCYEALSDLEKRNFLPSL